MTTLSRFLLGCVAALFVAASFASLVRAQAVPAITDEQRQRITTNCVTIKSTLAQLHASDALLRVNRGQVYESVASKLMDTFNGRLNANRLDNKAMTTVTSQYRSALNTFRADYIAYEQQLSEALKIDCVERPEDFYQAVSQARSLRSTVHDDVTKLHRVMDDYKSSVGDFLVNYQRVSQ